MPSKVTKIKGDGACLFRALSFAIFRTEDCHKAVRAEILKHMETIWDSNDRVRLHAAMVFQDKTGLQKNIPPRLVRLTAQEYIECTRMDVSSIWGGSTELEVAGDWLKTPIKVFYYGNKLFPPKSWVTYGSLPAYYNSHVVLLQWTNGDHYDFVSDLV